MDVSSRYKKRKEKTERLNMSLSITASVFPYAPSASEQAVIFGIAGLRANIAGRKTHSRYFLAVSVVVPSALAGRTG
jgi:hypothetical protein